MKLNLRLKAKFKIEMPEIKASKPSSSNPKLRQDSQAQGIDVLPISYRYFGFNNNEYLIESP